MRIAVIGAGGVGGYFGARLAAAGETVAFIQRGAHLQALRANGLRVVSPLGDIALPSVVATDNPKDVGPVDVVLITVKSGDTLAAGELARPLIAPDSIVISLQNGVENEQRLAKSLGRQHVLGGVAYILSLLAEPGVVRHSGTIARIIFGELDGRMTPRGQAFLDACRRAGIDAEFTANIATAIWAKFAVLCPHNGMTALTRLPIGPIRDDPDCREMLRLGVNEVIALAQARGIALPAELIDHPLGFFDRVPAGMTSSMHYDLTHGRPLELEWLNGAVVRLGRDSGVETPVNRFIYAALKLHAAGAA